MLRQQLSPACRGRSQQGEDAGGLVAEGRGFSCPPLAHPSLFALNLSEYKWVKPCGTVQ